MCETGHCAARADLLPRWWYAIQPKDRGHQAAIRGIGVYERICGLEAAARKDRGGSAGRGDTGAVCLYQPTFPAHPSLVPTMAPIYQSISGLTHTSDSYDAAKDEFEIAVDSTNAATIYAASDRASARDALNHLVRVYTLYTEMATCSAPDTPAAVRVPEGGATTAPVPKEPVAQNAAENLAQDNKTDPLTTGDPATGPPLKGEDTASVVGITPNYNPEEISAEVREEVKRRVGQRVRELKNAVEALEESASSE